MSKEYLIAKLTSRKLWLTIIGIITGIGTIIGGDTLTGSITVASFIITYVIIEGLIDAQKAKAIVEISAEVVDAVAKMTENKVDDLVADILEGLTEEIDSGVDEVD